MADATGSDMPPSGLEWHIKNRWLFLLDTLFDCTVGVVAALYYRRTPRTLEAVLATIVTMQTLNLHRQSQILVAAFVFMLAMAFVFASPVFASPVNLTVAYEDVTVSLLSGPPVSGTLVSADAGKIVIETKAGSVEKSAADIDRVRFANKMDAQVPPVQLLLLDGSKVYGTRLTGKSAGWLLKEGSGGETTIPSKSLKAALLKPIAPEMAGAWQAAILETKNSDAVIVARPTKTLDRINGVISQVLDASVSFDLDGQQIDIPMEKLAGLVWFQKELERVKPTIEVTVTDHSVWMADSFTVKADSIELKTQLGQSVLIPFKKLFSINYSTANIRWLSEIELLSAVADKQIDFKTPVASLDRAFLPRFVVGGRTASSTSPPGDRDLYFPSPGEYTFRVPQGFSQLQCKVERTDEGSQRTNLVIEVWQDDQKISEQALAHDVDFIEVNVALKPEKKTKLVVACKSKLMVGTEVTWKQPRLKR